MRNRDRTPLPRRRARDHSPPTRWRQDNSEKTVPHVPPSLSSRPVPRSVPSAQASSGVGERTRSPQDATRILSPSAPRTRPIQPLDVVGAILSKEGRIGHKQLHESVIQITGSPNAGKSKTAEMICDILEVRRVPTTSKRYWKLVNPDKNFAAAHYTNNSFWEGDIISWESFWQSFSSVSGTEMYENGIFVLEGHKMHETDKFNDHITTTVHLCGPKSLSLSQKTAKSKGEMSASVDKYVDSRRRFPSSPTLILRAADPADSNAFGILAHEILTTEFKTICRGTAQFLSTAALEDDCATQASDQR